MDGDWPWRTTRPERKIFAELTRAHSVHMSAADRCRSALIRIVTCVITLSCGAGRSRGDLVGGKRTELALPTWQVCGPGYCKGLLQDALFLMGGIGTL